MTGTLAHIFRHPMKAMGREALVTVTLTPDQCLPFDRVWAVLHERSKPTDGGWAHCANFLRNAIEPGLMAISSRIDGSDLTLIHPTAGQITIDPDAPTALPVLEEWLSHIIAPNQLAPKAIYRGTHHLTDTKEQWISINNLASHRAVQDRAGEELSIYRWRGNLWLDGLGPWEEREWVGKEVTIGPARLEVTEEIARCKATMANPDTGKRDVDTLGLLRTWDHQNFGVYARVIQGGDIALGDPAGR